MNDLQSEVSEPTQIIDDAGGEALQDQASIDLETDEPIDLEAEQEGDIEADDDQAEVDEAPLDEGEGETEPELFEVEIDGQTYQVPESVQKAVMRHADYTQKTQGISEVRKSLEAKEAEINALSQISQDALNARVAMMNVETQLGQYDNVNWAELENEDPVAASSHWRQYQQLKDQKAQIGSYLQDAQNKQSEAAEQMIKQRMIETREYAQKNIPNWSPQLDQEITQFAINDLGFDVDTLKGAYNPQVYKTLHLARIGAQTLARSQSAKPQPSRPKAKPLSTVSGKSAPQTSKDVSDMSMDEYADYMNKREAKSKR